MHGAACGELEAEVERWLLRRAADAAEDKAFGRDKSGEELPKWAADKKKRAEKIRAAKAALEAEAKAAAAAKAKVEAEEHRRAEGRKKPGKPAAPLSEEPDRKAQKNFTDPESRIMKTKDGFIQGYNAQAAVDATAQVIVAYALDAKQSDQHQLAPIADAIEANLGKKPAQMSADAGYCSNANLAALEERGIDGYIAPDRPSMPGKEKAAGRGSPPCAKKSGPAATPALSLKKAAARTGVRTDQAGARLPSVPFARRRKGRLRVGPRLPRPQHSEARSGANSAPERPCNGVSFANPGMGTKEGRKASAFTSSLACGYLHPAFRPASPAKITPRRD